MSYANGAFMRAFRLYTLSRGAQFSTYLTWAVRNELKSQCRDCHRPKNKAFKSNRSFVGMIDSGPSQTTVDRISHLISEDVEEIAKAILDAPGDLVALWQKALKEKRDVKSLIMKYLSILGWTTSSITEAFDQLSLVLGK